MCLFFDLFNLTNVLTSAIIYGNSQGNTYKIIDLTK